MGRDAGDRKEFESQVGQGWRLTPLRYEQVAKIHPVSGISREPVRFDLQQMEDPEISGVEYQTGRDACRKS